MLSGSKSDRLSVLALSCAVLCITLQGHCHFTGYCIPLQENEEEYEEGDEENEGGQQSDAPAMPLSLWVVTHARCWRGKMPSAFSAGFSGRGSTFARNTASLRLSMLSGSFLQCTRPGSAHVGSFGAQLLTGALSSRAPTAGGSDRSSFSLLLRDDSCCRPWAPSLSWSSSFAGEQIIPESHCRHKRRKAEDLQASEGGGRVHEGLGPAWLLDTWDSIAIARELDQLCHIR